MTSLHLHPPGGLLLLLLLLQSYFSGLTLYIRRRLSFPTRGSVQLMLGKWGGCLNHDHFCTKFLSLSPPLSLYAIFARYWCENKDITLLRLR